MVPVKSVGTLHHINSLHFISPPSLYKMLDSDKNIMTIEGGHKNSCSREGSESTV